MTAQFPPIAFALALVLAAAGCADRRDPAPVVYKGSAPTTAPAPAGARPRIAAGQPAPDARGVINYGGYSAAVARQGDTVESIAARVGLSGSALAAYNGLPAQHVPKPGDELILPPQPVSTVSAPVATAALEPVGQPPSPAAAPAASAPGSTGFDIGKIEKAIDTPGATPTGGAIDQPLTAAAPPPSTPRPAAPAAPAPAATPEPAAQAPETVARVAPAAPAPAAARFIAPVDGEIIRPFSRGAGNDGIDYGASAGAPVRAAAAGQIALVSESLGGLGTIVLIRHENDLLTVYGRVSGVTVQRGARVRQGEVIGEVAPGQGGADASLHFEVRRGAESVDPGDFLAG
jgi:murein DD-endopeptidase MepM/ murein hydrolase activator NlpD